MASDQPQHPLAAIESGMLQTEPIANLLRKVIILGGQMGSAELRAWASAELNGYTNEDAVPEYRKLVTGLAIDAAVGMNHITGQQVSPEEMSAVLGFEIPDLQLRQPIAELSRLAEGPRGDLKFTPGWGRLAMMKMDEGQPFQQTLAVYWQVHTSSIAGIVDRVMTKLANFVAEVRAQMPIATDSPTPEAVEVATTIVITGGVNQFSLGANSPVQSQKVTVNEGDLTSLNRELSRLGVDEAEWQDLLSAMRADSDRSGESPQLGEQTRSWVQRVTARIGNATGQVTVGAAGGALGDCLFEALKMYHGLV